MKTRLSNWKEESDLYEVVTGKMTEKEAEKKVSEKKGINNKVTINPKLSEAMEELGGEVLEVSEALAPSKKEINIMKKINLLQLRLNKEKKKTTAGAEKDIAVQQEEVGVSSSAKMKEAQKEAALRAKEEAAVKKEKKALNKEEFEAAVEYFYEEGINEEGIDLIIEEVGLEDFVDFVDFIHDETIFLNEEEGRSARKMNVRTKAKLKKDVAAIKADKSDVVARSTPKDVLSRARTERAFKKRKLAKPAAKKEAPTPAPTKAKKTAAVVKQARKATIAKSKKDFDGDGKKETPKQEHRGVRNKKITKAVAKAKPAQPKKPVSKDGLRAKIKSAYEAGVKRHRKATQPVRVFHKGMKAGAKKTVKFAKDVKKAVVGEKFDYDPMDDPDFDPHEAEKNRGVSGKNNPKGGKKLKDLLKNGKNVKEEVVHEKFATQAKDRKKLGQDHSVSGRRRDHSHDVDSALTDYVPRRGKGRMRPASKKEMRVSAMRDAGIKVEGFSNWRNDLEEAKVDKGKSDAEKAEARNKRNTPAGKNRKFDTSVFITRNPGESLSSARARKRAEAHKKKQDAARAAKSKERATGNLKKYDADGDGKVRVIDAGYKPEGQLVEKDLTAAERRALPNKDFALPGKGEGPQGKQAGSYPIPDEKHARSALSLVSQHGTPEEKAKVRAKVKKKFPGIKVSESRDKALEIVRANIIKKHGEGAIYDAKRDKPTEADKKKAAAERQKRQAGKNKAFADRAKKAGYKNPQDYANVVARYGSEDNYKKGRGLD